jgi:hypothetical protein
MPEYILLLHADSDAYSSLSPAEIQGVISRYKNWREALATKGHKAGGQKLQDATGRTMKNGGGKVVITDGPYAETREVVGGFFHFAADSFEQAVELSRDCPHLQYGTIEIRQIEPIPNS